MKRVAMALTLSVIGSTGHAQLGEPTLYQAFRAFAGSWSGRTQPIQITYVVSEDSIHLEGESCRREENARVPADCRPINEGYFIERTRLLHDYPNFGVKPVQILELSDSKIVRAEQNPVLSDRSQIITEELIEDGQTLRFTVEQRVNGRVERKLRKQILLDRVAH